MPRVIAALFANHQQAQQALQALLETGLPLSHIHVSGRNENREISSISGFRTLEVDEGAGASMPDLDLPKSDRTLFEQGLRRGNVLIAARIDGSDLDRAVHALDMFDPIDLDAESRSVEERAKSETAEADVGAPLGAGLTGGAAAGVSNTGILPGAGLMAEAADDLGTDEVRTGETTGQGQAMPSTVGTGARRAEERADREGVNELAHGSGPAPAGFVERHMQRGRVWVFGSPGGDQG